MKKQVYLPTIPYEAAALIEDWKSADVEVSTLMETYELYARDYRQGKLENELGLKYFVECPQRFMLAFILDYEVSDPLKYHIKGRNGKLVLFEKHENSINWEFDQKQVPLKFEKEEGLEIASIVNGEIEVVLKKEDV